MRKSEPGRRHIRSRNARVSDGPAYNGEMPEPRIPSIAIVGAGPRGASLLERIGAHLADRPATALDIHVIDDAPSGAGRIWRTDQDRELCMNTLSDAVTLFTEPGSSVAGAVRPGPTLYEWSLLALATEHPDEPGLAERIAAIPAERAAETHTHPIRAGLAGEYLAELRATRPETHPSRALYGEYLAWVYARAVAELPAGARVIRHRARAIGIERTGTNGHERVALSDGETIAADAVIIAAGWIPREQSEAEERLEREIEKTPGGLAWVRQGSPADQNLSGVPADAPAIVRGLGMGFFDTMALLTIGRGGVFVHDPAARDGLRYEPSGREPILHATSRRGVPFRAKSLYGGLPPRPEQRFLRAVDWDAEPRPIDFDRQLWPRIVADAFVDHTETLRRVAPDAVTGTAGELLAALGDAIAPHLTGEATSLGLDDAVARASRAAAAFIADPALRFDLAGEIRPAERAFASPDDFDAWVRERVRHDLAEAELGADSPFKAGLWSISAARAAANRIGTLGGFDAESRGSGFALLHAIGGMAGSGPPAFRARQLLALAEAGLVRFIGPEAAVSVAPHGGEGSGSGSGSAPGFVASSPLVAGSEVRAPALIDAWMHFHDVAATADPLTASLVASGRARAFAAPGRKAPGGRGGSGSGSGDSGSGDSGSGPGQVVPADRATGGFDVDGASGLLIGVNGYPDPAVHVAGIPADETLHDTIISPMPGTDPPMLRETDRVAGSALAIALGAHRGEEHPARERNQERTPA